ncbi:hypothetical protein HMPREF2767_05220 [Nosocomiicoccus sp. HMSC067E10]|uniref:nuclease-related domain-containing protein n=1 Tax=Nosocomiicoccus sp. HMSC067E10 TaxID=1739271 RepID=UPI0008A21B0C|nr:nuclease-related domain-containing protein [Nosocomiicoccus sp. HMSC067E10]OFL46311.1 hypothetical protein HMPREF2767_05220 [Nosocomiicoccus sp. HMSC067E10]
MSTEILTEPLFIIVAALLLIVIISFLIYDVKHRNEVEENERLYKKKEETLIESYVKNQEDERMAHKKEVSHLNEKYLEDTTLLNNKLSSIQQFTVDKGEYLTDLALLNFKNKLVTEERIRESDMYILSNIYLPSRNYTNTRKIDHLVLTRTGIYLIDSKYWSGHILHGVTEEQYDEIPYLEGIFQLLNLDPNKEQTLIFEKENDEKVAVNYYNNTIEDTEMTAEKLRNVLKLQFDVVPIIYFNPKDNGGHTIMNYATDSNAKVIVGTEQLEDYFNKHVFQGRFQYTVKDLDEIAESLMRLNP